MHTLITGGSGFIAQYLVNELQAQNHTVVGISRSENTDLGITSHVGNITDSDFVNSVIQKEKPSIIFHLAAQSNIPYSFQHPAETFETNINGTLHFLDALKETNITFISVGSSAEYGATAKENHNLSEDSILEPSSPYALSKMTQGKLVQIYKKAYNIKAVHVRPFAVIGPGKKGDALSDFAKGIVQIERGNKEFLEVGDLSTIRDFIDVRDAARAFGLIALANRKDDIYNICLGKGTSLSEMLDMLLKQAKTKITVKMNEGKKRPVDDRVIIGNPTRLFSLGFKPKIELKQTVEDVLNYWRENS